MSGILVNLLSNGVEAIRDLGGRYKGMIKMTTFIENDQFIFKIFNDGPEIPESHLSNIFKPLFTNGKAKGTGLGLASVVKSINLHKGSIRAENLIGQGVQFILEFCKGEQFEEISNYNFQKNSKLYSYNANAKTNFQNENFDHYMFLVLESSSRKRELLIETLNKLSLLKTIHFCSNFSEAEELIRKKKYDLYLLDSNDGGKKIYENLLSHLFSEVIIYEGEPPSSLNNVSLLNSSKRKKILYVDDAKIFRIAWHLFHGENNITCLSSPEEALTLIAKTSNEYEIFVLDYYYSNSSLNGLALGRKIKEFIPEAKILISSTVQQDQTEFISIKKNDYDIRKFLSRN